MPQDPSTPTTRAEPSGRKGAIRFGDDKTGVFIRVDNALGFSIALRSRLQDSPLASIWLGSWKTEMEILLFLLESSQVGQEDHEENDALAG